MSKEKSLINYELFRQRKKFNPSLLFNSNEGLTYEEFKNYFINKSVQPPDENYFLRVKNFYQESLEIDNKIREDETIKNKDETLPVEKDIQAIETIEKPKRKRVRKRKST